MSFQFSAGENRNFFVLVQYYSIMFCLRFMNNREWKRACLLAWILFCLYEILIFSQDSLCPHSAEDYGYFYTFANVSTLSGFGFAWIVLIARVLRSRAENERVPHLIAFHVASMGLITAILDITAGLHDGICIDVLG